jgi:hypothetical protein
MSREIAPSAIGFNCMPIICPARTRLSPTRPNADAGDSTCISHPKIVLYIHKSLKTSMKVNGEIKKVKKSVTNKYNDAVKRYEPDFEETETSIRNMSIGI